ncbi:30S ribosomal protein S3 [Patescibacteria group bacterium]|nr:30S ribosomal protein S3 [Patescibacteria group bacterium]
MGQKVNPKAQRIGIIHGWDSKWFATKKKYTDLIHRDLILRNKIETKLKNAGISSTEIIRSAGSVIINIHTAKPGLIIGRQGSSIEKLREELQKKFNEKFDINIIEVSKPDLDAKLIAESIARQIEKRIPYRRASKMAVQKSMEAGAKGIKINISGRLNGVEIARSEFFKDGRIPLHTFRADIDYSYLQAHTTYGVIGVKVWVYRKDVFKKEENTVLAQATPQESA